jgi:hypothetical protein
MSQNLQRCGGEDKREKNRRIEDGGKREIYRCT